MSRQRAWRRLSTGSVGEANRRYGRGASGARGRRGDRLSLTDPFPLGTASDLAALVRASSGLEAVRRDHLARGETLLVKTKNSFYVLTRVGDEEFAVAGGWFDGHAGEPARVEIAGCTWGRHAILTDVIAAPGLYLEFGNGVRTTRIQAVSRVIGRQNPTCN